MQVRVPDVGVKRIAAVCGSVVGAVALSTLLLAGWGQTVLSNALGAPLPPRTAVPSGATVRLTAGQRYPSPVVAMTLRGGTIRLMNVASVALEIAVTSQRGRTSRITLSPHATRALRLRQVGLYHYLAHPLGSTGPRMEGWLATLPHIPGLHVVLKVPKGQDLFTPKALVTVVGATVTVVNHDEDAHNFVVDPGSPAGAAFIVPGTQIEKPKGWQRALTIQQAGIYHVYCTLHTHIVGHADGWNIVAPTRKASGYRTHNPMEAWIIALPATTAGSR